METSAFGTYLVRLPTTGLDTSAVALGSDPDSEAPVPVYEPTAGICECPIDRLGGTSCADSLTQGHTLAVTNVTSFRVDDHSLGHVSGAALLAQGRACLPSQHSMTAVTESVVIFHYGSG
jgi:hypothetical protein